VYFDCCLGCYWELGGLFECFVEVGVFEDVVVGEDFFGYCEWIVCDFCFVVVYVNVCCVFD